MSVEPSDCIDQMKNRLRFLTSPTRKEQVEKKSDVFFYNVGRTKQPDLTPCMYKGYADGL